MQSDKQITGEQYFELWALIQESNEVPDTWVAHGLSYDILAHGASPKEAFEDLVALAVETIVDDLNRGFEPLARRAPETLWEPLWRVASNGARASLPGTAVPHRPGRKPVYAVFVPLPIVHKNEPSEMAVQEPKLSFASLDLVA